MKFEDARRIMVESQLRPNRVTDEAVLTAMGSLPRELFVPETLRSIAYVDEDLEIASGRCIMEPLILARLVQAAAPEKGDVALVVGAGSGYAAAVFARLCDTVFALESDAALAASATTLLSELVLDNVVVVEGSLAEGLPKQGPFNVILFNGGINDVPETVAGQLADGGRLVAVLGGENGVGRATLAQRGGAGVSKRVLFDASIPVLPEFRNEAGFVF
ncbi:MAG: protein-L-isoaspartate O-methyltransferase [Alphaproteobacteria bacterium]|nr:protein-L-isoaspartate O-methyltransferase [Alphaproteobacteria bacterium]